MGMVPDTWHMSVTCLTYLFVLVQYSVLYLWQFFISWSLLARHKCEGSKWGRISSGIQWTWYPTRDTCPSRVNPWFTHDFVTNDPIELQTSLRGQNGVEFHQESNGHGPKHVTCVLHVSPQDFHVILQLLIPLSYIQVWEAKMRYHFTSNLMGIFPYMWTESP